MLWRHRGFTWKPRSSLTKEKTPMKLASGICIPEPLPMHTGIKGDRCIHSFDFCFGAEWMRRVLISTKPFIFVLFLVGVTVRSAESLSSAIPLGTSTKRANSKRANHGRSRLFQDVSFWLRSFPVCGWRTRSLASVSGLPRRWRCVRGWLMRLLWVSEECLVFRPVYSHIVLRPRPGYVPKVPTTPFCDQVVNLQALTSEEADPAVNPCLPFDRASVKFCWQPSSLLLGRICPRVQSYVVLPQAWASPYQCLHMLPPFGQDVASVAPLSGTLASLPLRQAVTTNRKDLKPSFTEGRNLFRFPWGKEQQLGYLQQQCTQWSQWAPKLANLRWGGRKVAWHLSVTHSLVNICMLLGCDGVQLVALSIGPLCHHDITRSDRQIGNV